MPKERLTSVTVRITALLLITSLALAACSGGTKPTSTSSTLPSGHESTVYRFGVVGSEGKIAKLELRTPTVVAGITGTVVQIATSNSDGYALTSSGDVWAWGVDNYGELGDGAKSPYEARATRVHFPTGTRIISLPNPMPFDGALAIDSSGNVWGWGLDADGDLCLNGSEELQPVRIALNDVTLASGARTHSLFDSGGRVYACGSGDAGELGDGSLASNSKPAPVIGLPSGAVVTALTSSWEGSGALLSNGEYYDWGYNATGQLGNGATADSAVPIHVSLPAQVRQVSQGGSGAKNGQTAAILANGSVWAWGDNDEGQLGLHSTRNSDVPVRVKIPSGVKFVKVNSGGFSCYGIDSTGRLWAWGGNKNGQLGTGSNTAFETRPVEVGIDLTEVSSTASNVAGLESVRAPSA